MVNTFVPALRKSFIVNGYDMKDDGDVASHDNEFLIAANGVLYLVDEVYGVERTSNRLYVTGSGMELALGAAHALGLHEVDDWEEAVEIVEQAVKVAMKYDIYSGGSVQVALQNTSGKSWLTYLD